MIVQRTENKSGADRSLAKYRASYQEKWESGGATLNTCRLQILFGLSHRGGLDLTASSLGVLGIDLLASTQNGTIILRSNTWVGQV
jgi:hypothetical protein